MKTLLSFAFALLMALSINHVQAAAPSPDIVAEAPFSWEIDCADFECPLEVEIILTQSYWAHDCESIPEKRIKQAANQIRDEFCERFKACCGLAGCTSEGYCRLVDYTSACRTKNLLVIKVKIAYQCK